MQPSWGSVRILAASSPFYIPQGFAGGFLENFQNILHISHCIGSLSIRTKNFTRQRNWLPPGKMEEHRKLYRKRERYQHQYNENADSYRKGREEKVTYFSDVGEPEFMISNRLGELSLSSADARVPSPPPVQGRLKQTVRRTSSPPPRNPIRRSTSTGRPERLDQLEIPGGTQRGCRVQVSQYLSPGFPVSDHRQPLDDQVPSPTFETPATGPAIQVISPDEAHLTGERRSGHSWSRSPGSVAFSESNGRVSISHGSSHLGENVYTYTELHPIQFRLVKIFAARMAAIKCTIVHESLVEPPPYTAISYAWGDTDDKQEIRIDEAKIPISTSLFGALSALREKCRDVYVWADVLCIN
jgi:hypothetical protein